MTANPQTEGKRIASAFIACAKHMRPVEKELADKIDAAIGQAEGIAIAKAIEGERKRAKDLVTALNVICNRYGIIPLRFLMDKKLERYKHDTIAGLHEAWVDAVETLATHQKAETPGDAA